MQLIFFFPIKNGTSKSHIEVISDSAWQSFSFPSGSSPHQSTGDALHLGCCCFIRLQAPRVTHTNNPYKVALKGMHEQTGKHKWFKKEQQVSRAWALGLPHNGSLNNIGFPSACLEGMCVFMKHWQPWDWRVIAGSNHEDSTPMVSWRPTRSDGPLLQKDTHRSCCHRCLCKAASKLCAVLLTSATWEPRHCPLTCAGIKDNVLHNTWIANRVKCSATSCQPVDW